MNLKNILRSNCALLSTLLIACGGGGSSGGSTSGGGGTGGNSNSPPVFTSPTSFTFEENQLIGFQLTVSDPDNDTITIRDDAGGDGALFTVDPNTGNVSADAQDFEMPQDVNGDNVYEQNISLSDGTVTVNQTIRVTITNVNEPPSCTLNAEASFDENFVGDIYTFDGIDPEGDASSYLELIISAQPGTATISDRIRNALQLDFDTGVLSIIEPLDAETEGTDYKIFVQTSYGVPGEIANCSVALQLNDLSGAVKSGLRFNGQHRATQTITDIDGDGLDELWIETSAPQASGFDTPSGTLLFGAFLQSALDIDFAADIDLSSLTPSQGVNVSASFTDITNTDSENIGESLIARGLQDLDGDGTNELLLGLSSNVVSNTQNGSADRPLGYVIWGDNILSGISTIDLLALSPTQGLVIEKDPLDDFGNTRDNLTVETGNFIENSQDDIIIGLPDFDVFGDGIVGRTLIISGEALADAKPVGSFDPTNSDRAVTLSASNGSRYSTAGRSLAILPDINGDNAPELVSAANFDRVGVILSPALANLPTDITTSYGTLEGSGDLVPLLYDFGQSPSVNPFPLDADNDGVSDVLFAFSGGAHLVFGDFINGTNPIDEKILFTSVTDNVFNSALSLGDIDNDNIDEIVLSTSESPGRVFIIKGSSLSALKGTSFDVDSMTANEGVMISTSNPELFIGRNLTVINSLDDDSLNELVIPSFFGNELEGFIVRAADIVNAFDSGEVNLSLESLFDVETAP